MTSRRAPGCTPQQQVGRLTLFTALRVEQLVVGRAVEDLQVIHQLLTAAAIFQTEGVNHPGRDVRVVEQLGNQIGAALVGLFQQLGVLFLLLDLLMISRVRV